MGCQSMYLRNLAMAALCTAAAAFCQTPPAQTMVKLSQIRPPICTASVPCVLTITPLGFMVAPMPTPTFHMDSLAPNADGTLTSPQACGVLFKDGISQKPGRDYVAVGNQITLTVAAVSDDTFDCVYIAWQ